MWFLKTCSTAKKKLLMANCLQISSRFIGPLVCSQNLSSGSCVSVLEYFLYYRTLLLVLCSIPFVIFVFCASMCSSARICVGSVFFGVRGVVGFPLWVIGSTHQRVLLMLVLSYVTVPLFLDISWQIYLYCLQLPFICRCYLHSGDIDRGHKTFEDYMNSGNPPSIELYVVSFLTNSISALC
jgi:hypothetical protein